MRALQVGNDVAIPVAMRRHRWSTSLRLRNGQESCAACGITRWRVFAPKPSGGFAVFWLWRHGTRRGPMWSETPVPPCAGGES